MIMNKVLCFAVLVFIFAGCKDKREECIDLPPVSTPLVFTITNIQGAATLDVRGTLKAFYDGGGGELVVTKQVFCLRSFLMLTARVVGLAI